MQPISFYRTTFFMVLLLFFACSAQAQEQPTAPAFDIVPVALTRSLPSDARAALTRATERATTRSAHVIQFRNLEGFAERTDATVPLPNASSIKVRATRFDHHAGGFSWSGRSADGSQTAFFSVTGASVYGMIHAAGKTYSIEPAGGGRQLLIEVATEAFGPDEPEGFGEEKGDQARSEGAGGEAGGQNNPPSNFSMMTGGDPIIDVLVVYTAAAAATTTDMIGLINGAIASTNAAHANSLVAERLNLVGTAQVTYTEPGNAVTTRNDLVGTSDGKMDNVHTLRNSTHADLVILMTANVQTNVLGIAGAIGASASTGFAIVNTSAAIANYTFAHEIGHLMGAVHENDNTGSNPYSNTHGYIYAPGFWRTIMARPVPNVPSIGRIQYWSN